MNESTGHESEGEHAEAMGGFLGRSWGENVIINYNLPNKKDLKKKNPFKI